MGNKIFFLLIISIKSTYAQCAMCRATVESNANHGDIATALGLNKGIIYLFFTPYILVSILTFFFWKQHKKYKKIKWKTAMKGPWIHQNILETIKNIKSKKIYSNNLLK